jgi:hypothetical protein
MPDPVSDLVSLVRLRLAEVADPRRAPMPFRGVGSPALRAVCRAAYDDHPLPDRASWEAAVRELWDHASYRDEVTPEIRSWAVGDDLWLRRAAILSQLDHKGSTDVGLLAGTIVANLEGTRFAAEFFIRKAIGWALRQHARVDADWVREFVAEHERDLSGPEQA